MNEMQSKAKTPEGSPKLAHVFKQMNVKSKAIELYEDNLKEDYTATAAPIRHPAMQISGHHMNSKLSSSFDTSRWALS